MMPETLSTPLPHAYRIAEGFGSYQHGQIRVPGCVRIVRLNLHSSIARRWAKGELVTLTTGAVCDSAWYIGDHGTLRRV